jgi:hypothetical protein
VGEDRRTSGTARYTVAVSVGHVRMSSSSSLFVVWSALVGVCHLPSGCKSLSSAGKSGVTLEVGEADIEEAGGLGLGGAVLLYGLDYFLAQLF